MKDSQRSNFEQEWASAFENAEYKPSSALWEKVQQDLTTAENGQLKKRALVLWWVAAASISFAAVFSASLFFYSTNNLSQNSSIAQVDPDINLIEPDSNKDLFNQDSNAFPVQKNRALNSTQDKNENSEVNTPSKAIEKAKALTGREDNSRKLNSRKVEGSDKRLDFKSPNKKSRKFSSNYSAPSVARDNRVKNSIALFENESDHQSTETQIAALSLRKSKNKNLGNPSSSNTNAVVEGKTLAPLMPQGFSEVVLANDVEMEEVYEGKYDFSTKKDEKEVWAGLAFDAGSFRNNPVNSSSADINAESDFNAVGPNNYRSDVNGFMQGAGISLGTDVGKKFLLVSGLHYSTINTGYYEGVEAYDPSLNVSSAKESYLEYNSSQDAYLQEDRYHFIHIPARIGYEILNGKLGWDVFTGIDSRIYAGGNTWTYINGDPQYTAVDRDINAVSFWGGLNTELSYQFHSNYQVGISTGFRMSLNSLESNNDALPTIAELGFNLRYIFN